MYLVFLKVDGKWLFDDIDYEKLFNTINATATQAEEFKPIENIQIAGEASDGRKIGLADLKGKVVLIDFWGTWCGPCLASLPELTTLHEEFHSKGFDILGIAADDVETLNSFLSDKPLRWTNIVDGEGGIAGNHGIAAYPTTLLIDKNGEHVATNLHGETLRKAIELLLADKSLQSVTGKAAEVLEAGLQQAASDKKLVFLHVGSSELGQCKQLARWMSLPEVKGKLEEVFVDVSIDMAVNAGAEEVVTSISPNSSGFPWFAFLDPTQDQPVATCEAASMGNIGFPQASEGIEHFVKMFEATGRFTADDLGLLRKSLDEVMQQGLKQHDAE